LFSLQSEDLVIHQPDSVLDAMNVWCKEHHGKVGTREEYGGSLSAMFRDE